MRYIILALAITSGALSILFQVSMSATQKKHYEAESALNWAVNANNIKEVCRGSFIDHINAGHIKQRKHNGGLIQGTYYKKPAIYNCEVQHQLFSKYNEPKRPFKSKAVMLVCTTHAEKSTYAGSAITYLGCYTDDKNRVKQLDVYFDRIWRQKTLIGADWSDAKRVRGFSFNYIKPTGATFDKYTRDTPVRDAFFNREKTIYGETKSSTFAYKGIVNLKKVNEELLVKLDEITVYRNNFGFTSGGLFFLFLFARSRARKKKLNKH